MSLWTGNVRVREREPGSKQRTSPFSLLTRNENNTRRTTSLSMRDRGEMYKHFLHNRLHIRDQSACARASIYNFIGSHSRTVVESLRFLDIENGLDQRHTFHARQKYGQRSCDRREHGTVPRQRLSSIASNGASAPAAAGCSSSTATATATSVFSFSLEISATRQGRGVDQ